MTKIAPDTVLDAALDVIATADEMHVCSGVPTNYADISTVSLAGPVSMTPGDGNGDYAISDGSVSGRRLVVTAKSGAAIHTSGTGTQVVLADSGSSAITFIAECTPQSLVSGNTVNVSTWTVEIRDPT